MVKLKETIDTCECGALIDGGTCHECGLVWSPEYAYPDNVDASWSPFLPSDGLTIDSRSMDSYIRRRSYEGARWIKQLKSEIFFPSRLAEGAMIRFNDFLSKKPAFRGERYKVVAGICVLMEAQSWDFPVLEREIMSVLDIEKKAFRKKRRKMGVVLVSYSTRSLVNKYFNLLDLSMDQRASTMKWLSRCPDAVDPRAAVAASLFLGTRKSEMPPTLESLASFMEITKSEIAKARKIITRSAIP